MSDAARVPMTAEERVCEAQRQGDEAQGRLKALWFEDCGGIKCLVEVPAAAGGKLCLGTECLDRGLWALEPAIGTLGRLGIHSCRLQTGWARTEREKGVFDFSEMDAEVRQTRAAGFAPWLSLSYGNPLYFSGRPGLAARGRHRTCADRDAGRTDGMAEVRGRNGQAVSRAGDAVRNLERTGCDGVFPAEIWRLSEGVYGACAPECAGDPRE